MVQSFDESERATGQPHTGLEYLTEPDSSAELEDLALNPAFDSPPVEPVGTSTAESPESSGEITGLEGITEINLDNLDPAADPSAGNMIPAEPPATSPSVIAAASQAEVSSAEVSPDAASPGVVPLGSNFSESIAPAPDPLPIDSEKEVSPSQPAPTLSPDAASAAQPIGLQPEAQSLPTPEPTIQSVDTATPAAVPVEPIQEQAAIPVEPVQEQEQAVTPSAPLPDPEVTPVEPAQVQSGGNTVIQSGQPTLLQPELQSEAQASVPAPAPEAPEAPETSPELEAVDSVRPAPSDSDTPPARIVPIPAERVEDQGPDLPPASANGTGVVWSNENPNFHRMEVEGQPSGPLNGQISNGLGPAPLQPPAPPPTVQTMQVKQPPPVIPGRPAATVLPDSEQRDPRYEAASARQSQQIFITFIVLAVGLLLGFLANPFQNRNNRSIPPETVNQGP
ncbi:hypothetical protein [Leptolyngbya sp. FACHB-261]|uniref:hypothetical protein n=1 Tax=Leptolyngbya sp. FACHB-261 TaxID=2692806 RepID=UPI001683F686|nr:hypothetical protein [Leptolyngbya sp. FACHB-261]MBD2102691.1 hypothetical protein [Leptolyngbya sp. FACHB-261]